MSQNILCTRKPVNDREMLDALFQEGLGLVRLGVLTQSDRRQGRCHEHQEQCGPPYTNRSQREPPFNCTHERRGW